MKTDKNHLSISSRKWKNHFYVMLLLFLAFASFAADDVKIQVQGLGFVRSGQIVNSSDTLNYNYNKNVFLNASAQITAVAEIQSNWEGALGIGATQYHRGQGNINNAGKLQLEIKPFLTQARFTYVSERTEKPKWKGNLGMFLYNYNKNVKNLGLYLLRGSVYPGILISGFETAEVTNRSNVMGFNIENNLGQFGHSLILKSEVEIPPVFDLSLIYLAQYNFGDIFELGAGVNFYRLIPNKSDITLLEDHKIFAAEAGNFSHPYERKYTYIDSVVTPGQPTVYDTTWMSHAGTKLVSFFSLDIQQLLNLDISNPDDYKIYGEIGLIGINNSNAYKELYGSLSQRMPIMLGINIPCFGYLDHLSLEMEYYGAPYRDDYVKIMDGSNSPIPVSNRLLGRTVELDSNGVASIIYDDVSYPNESPYNVNENVDSDNFKWSLHGAKTLAGHFKISAQIANDHFRVGGVQSTETYETALTTLKDWYWMLKVAYFF